MAIHEKRYFPMNNIYNRVQNRVRVNICEEKGGVTSERGAAVPNLVLTSRMSKMTFFYLGITKDSILAENYRLSFFFFYGPKLIGKWLRTLRANVSTVDIELTHKNIRATEGWKGKEIKIFNDRGRKSWRINFRFLICDGSAAPICPFKMSNSVGIWWDLEWDWKIYFRFILINARFTVGTLGIHGLRRSDRELNNNWNNSILIFFGDPPTQKNHWREEC